MAKKKVPSFVADKMLRVSACTLDQMETCKTQLLAIYRKDGAIAEENGLRAGTQDVVLSRLLSELSRLLDAEDRATKR